MLTYRPGETFAHRLDPRSKLALQVGFAIAVFAATGPVALGVLAALGLGGLAAARLSPVTVVRSYAVLLVVLAMGPLLAMVTVGPPWIEPMRALPALRSVSRVGIVLLISSAYVVSTPIRESRAAVQWLVPGRFGQLLGVGVGLTFRLLPVLRRDVARIRQAIRARGGGQRPITDRARRLVFGATRRSFVRADRLSIALRARCFAWNPTLPPLRLTRRDYPVLALGVALALWPLARALAGASL